jgi:curved DNA-binding protein CbpA
MSYQPSPPSTPNDPKAETNKKSSSTSEDDAKELNFYEILRASPTATRSELKKKYITLARVSHPDAQIASSDNHDGDVDFQKIAEAWRTLGNPKSRRRYDRQLKAKAWGEAAQKITNDSLDQVAPVASSFMDNLAVPFLKKTSQTVGKAFATAAAVSDAVAAASQAASTSSAQSPIKASKNGEAPVETKKAEVSTETNAVANVTKTAVETPASAKPVEATIETTEINGAAATSSGSIPEQKNSTAPSATTTDATKVADTSDQSSGITRQELEEQ